MFFEIGMIELKSMQLVMSSHGKERKQNNEYWNSTLGCRDLDGNGNDGCLSVFDYLGLFGECHVPHVTQGRTEASGGAKTR
jgi:hypothetical protein